MTDRIEQIEAELARLHRIRQLEHALAEARAQRAAPMPTPGSSAPEPFTLPPSMRQHAEPRPAPHPGLPAGHGAGGHSALAAAVSN